MRVEMKSIQDVQPGDTLVNEWPRGAEYRVLSIGDRTPDPYENRMRADRVEALVENQNGERLSLTFKHWAFPVSVRKDVA